MTLKMRFEESGVISARSQVLMTLNIDAKATLFAFLLHLK